MQYAQRAAADHRNFEDDCHYLPQKTGTSDNMYLFRLADRVARGLQELDPSRLKRHRDFLVTQRMPDGGFRGREGDAGRPAQQRRRKAPLAARQRRPPSDHR